MGLLDDFSQFVKTPEGMGLLSAVAGGLAGAQRGQPINSLGRAGLAGVMGYGNALDRQERTLENEQQRKLRQMQMDEAARKLAEQKKTEDFYTNVIPGLMSQKPQYAALSNGMGPTVENAARIPDMPQAGTIDAPAMYRAMLESGIPGLATAGLQGLTKQEEPIALGDGGMLVTKSGKKLMENPKVSDDPVTKLINARDNLPVGDPRRSIYENAITKATTHAPPSATPFYQFLPTPEGYVAGNARTGTAAPVEVAGKPVVRSQDSPSLQGSIAEAEKLGAKTGEQKSLMQGKEDALASVKEASKMLNQGIYSGAYANLKMKGAKFTPGVSTDTAARTEEFMAYIGNTVVPRLQEFGGNDSNEELRYLRGIMGGEITMEEKALKKILADSERKIQAGINRLKMQPKGGQDNNDPLGLR